MILLTLTLGSRNYFSRRALISEDHLLRQKILRISLDIFPRPLCSSPLQFTATDISLWISTCTCHSHDHFSLLWLLQDALNYSCCPKNPLSLLSCSFISHENPYGFFLTFIEDPFFSVVHLSHIILRNTFRSFKNPLQPIILQILACLHYG